MNTPAGGHSAATLYEASKLPCACDPGLKAAWHGTRVAGPAFTVRGIGGDNLALHNAVLAAPAGSVLVADMQGAAPLFHGDFASYDPWDAAHRTEVDEYPSSTMCSVFRSFQGWLAMSQMQLDQGVLHVVPIPAAMAYMLIRPLLDDVPEDSLCGAEAGMALAADETWHPLLMEAVSGIPDVEPGDSVWWHSDLIHSVEPVENQKGWGNVIYIPAAPLCAKNAAYAENVAERFRLGESPTDFPKEDYETDWENRFKEDNLNEIGARGLGITRQAKAADRAASI